MDTDSASILARWLEDITKSIFCQAVSVSNNFEIEILMNDAALASTSPLQRPWNVFVDHIAKPDWCYLDPMPQIALTES